MRATFPCLQPIPRISHISMFSTKTVLTGGLVNGTSEEEEGTGGRLFKLDTRRYTLPISRLASQTLQRPASQWTLDSS
jgi:hypothetical protein